jgi:hypothetical protein
MLIFVYCQNNQIMKKILFSTLILFFFSFSLVAQHLEITPFGGYVFPVTWNAPNGGIYFNGNAQYGGMINIGVSRVVDVDLIYNRIDTKANAYLSGYADNDFSLSINYMMVGATKNFRVNQMVSPFFGMNLGACLMSPKESSYSAYWFFAVGAQGGVKFYFSKVIGLRLQAQMYVPIQGGGFYFYGTPYGGGTTVYVSSTMVDFGFTGGLIFRIGEIMY